MNITIALFCVVIVLFGIGIFFLARYFNAGKKKASQITPTAEKQASHKGWQIWILYFGITFTLAVWTIVGALFFLFIVWLLRKDPSAKASDLVSDNEKKTARRVYTWLFWSSIITVPVFIGTASNLYKSTINESVIAALIPLFVHLFLLLGLTSKSRFVYRHTQQGILLIALRAGMASLAAVNVENHLDYALTLFFLGNGALWLFGSLIGWSQTSDGKCWFMERKGEQPISAPQGIPNLPAQKHIEQSQAFIHRYKPAEAKQHALAAFRTGDREIKSQALKLLRTLDEVEKF